MMPSDCVRLLLLKAAGLLIVFLAACQPAQPTATPPPGVRPTATGPEIRMPTSAGSPAVSATPAGTAAATATPEAGPSDDLSHLPISFPIMSAEMAEYFNQIARPDDTALLPVAQLRWLPYITAGKVKAGFPSWSQAESQLPELADKIAVGSYNPEHWEQTPQEEQSNLPETVRRAQDVAHQYDLQFMVAPDRRFARDYLRQIAPAADMIALQGQRIQQDPEEFAAWVREMIAIAREANPQIKIFVQVGAHRGTAEEMLAALQTVAGEIDGISIWVNPNSLETLKEFLALIRPEG